MQLPTAYQRLQIAVHAGVNPRTVLKAYRSEPIRSTVAARVRAACNLLQLPEPPIVIAQK
jgi:hypothetical protein